MRFLPLVALTLSLASCDLVEVVPPDGPPVEPPPAQPVHPYGAGNGKVVFLSDLAVAQRIDVTLGGEAIGAVTKFVGCPSRVVADDSLATAIRPAGTYQYSARSTTGLTWASSSVRIDEDGLKRITFTGRPSQYGRNLPSELEGYPVTRSGGDTFSSDFSGSEQRLIIRRPNVVQGDRVDVVFNGTVVARGLALGTTNTEIPMSLLPGPNWYAIRLSHDPDRDGTSALFQLNANGTGYRSIESSWSGANIRYSC